MDFANALEQQSLKEDLVEVMKEGMNEVLGESSSSAVIYYLGGIETLKRPDVFEDRLQKFFGGKADVILKSILKKVKKI